MTTRQDDFDRGLVNRRVVLGDEWVDRSLGNATALNAEFQSLITRGVWHEIWSRPGLDRTTRRLLVLAMTMAQGRWEEFELHLRAAIVAKDGGGVPLATLKEVLLQGAAYCGVPAANTAFKLAADVCRAEGIVLDPAPLTPAVRVQHHHTFSTPQLHVAVQGCDDGVPVMLSHALGLDLTMWDGLAAALASGHPVLRYDHRAQGASAAAAGPFTLDDLVDDAARLVREWGRGPVIFVGLSMGGMVAQGLAIRHPDLVRGLVLANTTAQYPEAAQGIWAARIAAVEEGGMASVAQAVVERYLHADFRAANPAVAAALHAQLLRADAPGYAASCQAIRSVDWLAALAQVRCPTLVLSGARDVGATPAMGQAIAERVPGAQFEVFDQASHLSVAEQPARFEAAVRGLIARTA
jgi:3-oxoadipate enol-lactonase